MRLDTIARGLEHPWSLALLPDGGMLVSERPGRLRIIRDGRLVETPVRGLPEVEAVGQGGLLDVALHPDFADNRMIYWSFSARSEAGIDTHVARGRLIDDRLTEVETIFRSNAGGRGGRHFGSRLVFDGEGALLVTHGDRGDRQNAQDPSNHAGSVLRLTEDGEPATGNPFVGREGSMPEIFTFGHRNPQGMAIQPETGLVWTHEHGPQGGDEVNVLRAGANYGWPVVSHGEEYGSGRAIGEGSSKPGLEDPLHVWVPSIAPSGMAFYDSEAMPGWKGDLLVGALKYRMLVRLDIENGRIIGEERMLEDTIGRIRDVRIGPHGEIYLLSDSRSGGVFRLTPYQ